MATISLEKKASEELFRENLKVLPKIQLEKIAEVFCLQKEKITQQLCFDTIYDACKKKQWTTIDQIPKETLDEIINGIGRSLLLESLCTNETNLSFDLIERKIAMDSRDLEQKPAIHYAITRLKHNEESIKLISLLAQDLDIENIDHWISFRELSENIDSILDKKKEVKTKEVAILREKFANWLQNRAHYEEAFQELEKIYEFYENLKSENTDVEKARILTSYGTILMNKSEYEKAHNSFEKALEIRDKKYGSDHRLTLQSASFWAHSMFVLAQGNNNKSKMEEAEGTLLGVLKIRKEKFGVEHLDIAESLLDLATIDFFIWKEDKKNLQRLKSSLGMYAKSYEIRKNIYGDQGHPDVGDSLYNFANCLFEYGIRCDISKMEEVKKMHEEAFEIMKRFYGKGHLLVAASLGMLARTLVLFGMEKKDKSYIEDGIKKQEVVIEIIRASYEKENPLLLTQSLENLALYSSELKKDEAIEKQTEPLEVQDVLKMAALLDSDKKGKRCILM